MITTEDIDLKAIFKEYPDGHYHVKIKGLTETYIEGKDFKESMCNVVKLVTFLKKSNKLPGNFNITSHLKIILE